jgi:hypothetical protein
MDLPSHLKFKGVLTQGGAFKARLSINPRKARYYFILNVNPRTDIVLVIVTSTTDFFSHKSCAGGDYVHVNLSPRDYSELTAKCLVCCNRPRKMSKTILERDLQNQKYELLKPLPKSLLNRILSGIEKSPVVASDIKELVLGGNK